MKALSFFKKISLFVFLMALTLPAFAYQPKGSEVRLSTTNFDGNLDGTITDVQKLADAVDEIAGGGGGGGDVTAVGDCSTGACFTGVSGDTLTFDNAGGDGILSYDGTDFNIDKSFSLGTAGVRLSADGDGAITFKGLGNGSDEDLTINLDDTADTGTVSSSTGLTVLVFSSISLTANLTGNVTGNASTATALAANGSNCSAGSAPLGVDASGAAESCTDYEEDLSNSAGLAAALSDETGSGAVVFATSPTLVTPALGTIASGVGTALTALDGENISDDTIDDDSIDFVDVTLADITFDVGSVDTTEFGYLNGVTSAIQTQLNAKVNDTGDTITGAVTINDNGGTGSTLLTIGDANDADSVQIYGDLTVTGDDITMGTNTSGYILVADATNFSPVAMSGDVTIDSTGATTIGADKVALTTDTTGNYVADVAGTSNEISVSHTPAEGSTATISIPATVDLGGKTSFEIPNAAAPTVDAFGEIAGDNDLWAASRGAPVFFDGTASTALINVLVSDAPSNGQVPKWNTGGTITWEDDTQSAGSATAWDDIADPDADATIAFAGYEETITTSLDAAGKVALKIDHTDADVANATTLLQIQSIDDADADLTYIKIVDDSGGTPNTVFSVGADGATAMDGGVTAGGTVEGATLTEGGNAVYNSSETPGGELGGTWASPTVDDTGITLTSITIGALLGVDSIDATGAVDMDYGSADITDHTFVTDGTGDAEIVLPDGSIGSAEILNGSVTAADTALTAGRSLTFSTNDIAADVELYTESKTWKYPASPVATDDDKSIWCNDTANTFTVTKLKCESDQTVTMMLQVDDGTPADMDSVDLVCISTPDTDVSLDGDATVAAGDCVDVDTVSVSGTPTWASVTFTGTWDD